MSVWWFPSSLLDLQQHGKASDWSTSNAPAINSLRALVFLNIHLTQDITVSSRQTDLSVGKRRKRRAGGYCSKRKPNGLRCPIRLGESNQRAEEDGKISPTKIICC